MPDSFSEVDGGDGHEGSGGQGACGQSGVQVPGHHPQRGQGDQFLDRRYENAIGQFVDAPGVGGEPA